MADQQTRPAAGPYRGGGGQRGGGPRQGGQRGPRQGGFSPGRERSEFIEKVVQIDRVSRVVKGGRRFRFRATVVLGDGAGRVGIGIGKGGEVITAIAKAVEIAKKHMVVIPLSGTTIPHEITVKFAGAHVMLRPASEGTGVIAGGAVRAVVEAAGVKDILSKSMGSSNKLNNVQATMLALTSLQARPGRRVAVAKAAVVEPLEEAALITVDAAVAAPAVDAPVQESPARTAERPKKASTRTKPVQSVGEAEEAETIEVVAEDEGVTK